MVAATTRIYPEKSERFPGLSHGNSKGISQGTGFLLFTFPFLFCFLCVLCVLCGYNNSVAKTVFLDALIRVR
jgi:hypothetical protein